MTFCATISLNDIRAQYIVEFDTFSDAKSPPIEIVQVSNIIPWKKGGYEPLYGTMVSQNSGGKFNIAYEVYSIDPKTNQRMLVEISPMWFVKIVIISPDLKEGVKFGEYEFAIYVQGMKKPVDVIPFKLVPF